MKTRGTLKIYKSNFLISTKRLDFRANCNNRKTRVLNALGILQGSIKAFINTDRGNATLFQDGKGGN